ncbi:MAG: hypothetical protein ABI667_01540 [Sphingomicrobium sp.]
MTRRFAILALSLALPLAVTACGDTAPLRPAAGQEMPVKPAMAQVTPTVDDLLTPPPFAAPERVDELVKKSQARQADRFDLPPPGAAAPPVAGVLEVEEDPNRVIPPQ